MRGNIIICQPVSTAVPGDGQKRLNYTCQKIHFVIDISGKEDKY